VSTVQPVANPLVDAAANLRRSAILGAVLGVVGIIVASVAGHPLMGVFGFLGLGIGAVNNRMLQQSVIRYATDEGMGKKQFRRGVMARLATVTLIAIGIGFWLRPDGLGLFIGLAAFQILMLIGAAVPVFRSLRPTT
jgi:hypothetical protein